MTDVSSRFSVTVGLKEQVLDLEGRAIEETLQRLGYRDLETVRVRKKYELEFARPVSRAVAEKMATELLTNPVAETYQIEG